MAGLNPPTPLRILTFDGGPSALNSLHIASRLEKQHPGFLERTSLFVGTSAGAFVSLFLAHALQNGKSGSEAIAGCVSFLEEIIRSFRVGPRQVARFVSGFRSLHDGQELKSILQRHFGDATLGSLTDRPVSIVAFDASIGALTTYHPFEPGAETQTSLVDVALASCAFPLLLPLFSSQNSHKDRAGHLISDGGLSTNDVILAALSDALRWLNASGARAPDTEDIRILSMGRREPTSQELGGWMGRYRTLKDSLGERLFPRSSEQTQYSYGWLWLLYQNVDAPRLLLDASDSATTRFAEDLQAFGPLRVHRFDPPVSAVGSVLRFMVSPESFFQETASNAERFWESTSRTSRLKGWVEGFWMDGEEAPAAQQGLRAAGRGA